jgi:hypothetical protein
MIRFLCPSCHVPLSAPAKAAGHHSRCGKCGQTFAARARLPWPALWLLREKNLFLTDPKS